MQYIFMLFLCGISLFGYDNLRQKALSKGLRPIPKDFETLRSEVDDKYNPLSREKILLGKQLFFDKNLSRDRTIACTTCHDLKKRWS